MSLGFYDRQIRHIGAGAQDVLSESIVTIVGVGGLGSAAAQLLARMGVGILHLIDADTVEEHNLSRQQLYTLEDIGVSKALACKSHIERINPHIRVIAHHLFVAQGMTSVLAGADLILDCVDNHETRRLIDSYCSDHKIVWVHGAAIKEQGSIFVFDPKRRPDIVYSSLYSGSAGNEKCADLGVTAPIVSLVGTLQAQLALNILLARPVPEGLLRIDASSFSVREIPLSSR
ncbi:MAG: HesA/MoeB/ThiF family protein [Candidatus Woesearchaeota archaeon]